ncbi:type I-E CRISPR-associated protein Cas7/Cse4/CasC [Brachybacterium vulturis]|uniref:Type I-E CRISPR-associated protein Cas7/Cse4/CasC n=1 Tax=Brachybacterium vulturis TaxID=2017484 RepID=A0A291GKY5_9MICO|nr:type I-E CRISPR-associated protein Cas7/Cse4/CasC [Brachybacterium vulturis]ATG50696.1 type I-E CRISPR-associated protein Cas7/Cse4/CasC [Brachybacterium vulturis]
MSLVLDIHALHTLPPSNINRDDTGAPKSAVFGGVPRHRVSSQSWKRAIRRDFEKTLGADHVGFRTKRVADLVADRVQELTKGDDAMWDRERADAAAMNLFTGAGIKLTEAKVREGEEKRGAETGYLLFLSPRQIDNAARKLVETDGAKPSKKEARALLDDAHSIDIAMFGRMVADAPDYNVDASVQVAHAIGIHESEPEFDYYTAVDDIVEDKEETGAGMIGTMQMTSSTLYRFATVDLRSLQENLGDANAAVEATTAFVNSFITSLPSGKQNSYAHNTVPELVYLTIRDTRSLSLVNAFESPVRAADGVSRREAGAQLLASEAKQLESNYGFVPVASFAIGLGALTEPFTEFATVTTLPALADQLRSELTAEDPA